MRTSLVALLMTSCVLSGCAPTTRPAPVGAQAQEVPPLQSARLPPPGWTVHSITGTTIQLASPPDWNDTPIATVREMIVASLPATTGDVHAAWTALVEMIDAGRVHFVAQGPSAIKPWSASLLVLVDSGDVSLDAAVTRLANEPAFPALGGTREAVAKALPIGRAMRVLVTTDPSGGAPTQGVEYIIRLADGKTLSLIGSTRLGDTGFLDLMTSMAESVSHRVD